MSDRARSNGKSTAHGFTRRAFLKGTGVAAATAAIGEASLEAMAAEEAKGSAIAGPGAVKVTLKINGQNKALQIEPRTTLAEALRFDLDMTGTKVVCDRGSCSACTVMVDGQTVCSCMTLAMDARGKEIKTIEGLASGEQLHPVQEQFIRCDAMQCGFCTPGMIMTALDLVARSPDPSDDAVRGAIHGNLCRCTGYQSIVASVRAGAAAMRDAG
jgi:aerobic-type carbon monoxide dehydrogenase small subunit (CoxS/CutS family)